jgi:hypothetical protein
MELLVWISMLRKSQLKKHRTPSFHGPLAVVTSPHGPRTLLHLGAKNGHVALVKLWLDSEFDSNIEALIKAEFGAIATNEGPVHLDPRPPRAKSGLNSTINLTISELNLARIPFPAICLDWEIQWMNL